MQLQKFFRLYRLIIIMVVMIIVSVIGFIAGVIPLIRATAGLVNDVNTASSDVTLLKAKAGILQSMDEDTLRKNLLALSSAVPPDKSIASVMTTIDGVSARTGVSVSDISIQRPGSIATESANKLSAQEKQIGSNILPVTVAAAGNFDQARSFLSAIIAVRRYFRLQAFTVSFFGAGTNTRADLITFYKPYPSTIGGVIQPITALSEKEEATIARVTALPLESGSAFAVGAPPAIGIVGKPDPFSP